MKRNMYGLIRWYYVIFLLYYSIEVCHGAWKILFDDVILPKTTRINMQCIVNHVYNLIITGL